MLLYYLLVYFQHVSDFVELFDYEEFFAGGVGVIVVEVKTSEVSVCKTIPISSNA